MPAALVRGHERSELKEEKRARKRAPKGGRQRRHLLLLLRLRESVCRVPDGPPRPMHAGASGEAHTRRPQFSQLAHGQHCSSTPSCDLCSIVLKVSSKLMRSSACDSFSMKSWLARSMAALTLASELHLQH